MTETGSTVRPAVNYGRLLLAAIGCISVVICAVLILGAHFPDIPYIGVFGSLALSLWPAWFVLIPLAGGALTWRLSQGVLRQGTFIMAILAALGAAIVTYQLTSVARANDVELAISSPFGFAGGHGGILTKVAPDEKTLFTRDLGDDLYAYIYRPTGKQAAGRPVLVYVHGGGWIEGSADVRSTDMRWFAERGWVVVSVDYSLSNAKRHLWNRATDQIGCALAWTAANIGTRGGDPSRISLIGESAGGNLVLNAAYMANAGKLGSTCGGVVPRISAVSAIYPGVDLTAIFNNRYQPTGPDVNSMVRKYIGGAPQQFADRFAAVASATHIGPAAPPTLLFISENDHLVPVESMRAFDLKARKAGINMRTISVPFAEHGFDATGVGNSIVRQATLQFIQEHGARTTTSRP